MAKKKQKNSGKKVKEKWFRPVSGIATFGIGAPAYKPAKTGSLPSKTTEQDEHIPDPE